MLDELVNTIEERREKLLSNVEEIGKERLDSLQETRFRIVNTIAMLKVVLRFFCFICRFICWFSRPFVNVLETFKKKRATKGSPIE